MGKTEERGDMGKKSEKERIGMKRQRIMEREVNSHF